MSSSAWSKVPELTRDSLRRYLLDGIPTGGFLTAVLCNDLREAFVRADEGNTEAMKWIVASLYNYFPAGCWGSEENFRGWLAHSQTTMTPEVKEMFKSRLNLLEGVTVEE